MSEKPGSEEQELGGPPEGESGVRLYRCQYCGSTNSPKYGVLDTPIKLASHAKYECDEAKKHREKEEFKEAERKVDAAREVTQPQSTQTERPPAPDELTPRQRVAMYGPPELEKLKRETLKRFLSGAPQVTPKLSDWLLQQWDMDSNVREDPNYLNDLLRDSGIPAHIGYRAVNLIIALDEEMREVLEQRTERFRIPRRRDSYGRESYPDRMAYGYGYERRPSFRGDEFPERRQLRRVGDGVYETEEGYRQPLPGDYGQDQMGWRIEREVDRATRPILEKLDKVTEELKERDKPKPEQNVEIWRPKIGEDGNIMADAQGKPILERISAPASMAERFMPREDPELNMLKKMEYYKTMFGPPGSPSGEEVTIEKVRQVIREEKEVLTADKVASIIDEKMKGQSPTVNPELSKMQTQIDELTKELQSTKDKMTQDRFDLLNKKLEDMQTTIRTMSTGEFKEDGMRLLAKSMDELVTLAKERKPLEKAMDKMMPEIPGIPETSQPTSQVKITQPPAAPPPVPKIPTEEAKKGPVTAIQKLETEGYVIEK